MNEYKHMINQKPLPITECFNGKAIEGSLWVDIKIKAMLVSFENIGKHTWSFVFNIELA